jgi:hypothetical protein
MVYKAFLGAAPVKTNPQGFTVIDASNLFLHAKEQAVKLGELAECTFADYFRTAKLMADFFGRETLVESLTPADFQAYKAKLSETRSIVTMGSEITRVRVLFKWCYEAQYITTPLRFGPGFGMPSAKTLRRHRRERGPCLSPRRSSAS